MSIYYSRSTNIELTIQSLQRLRVMCEGSNHLELSDTFVIRIKIMQRLAQLALDYSLKVSYLEEQKEYAPMADLLDDVYLQLPRKNLQYISNDYRKIVSLEYDAMRSVIDLMDERLKTIRVVCFTRRSCQKPRRQRRAKKSSAKKSSAKISSAKISSANEYRTPTVYGSSECQDPLNDSRKLEQYVFLTPESEEDDPDPYDAPVIKNELDAFEPGNNDNEVFNQFKTQVGSYLKSITEYRTKSTKGYIKNPVMRFIVQCTTIGDLCRYITSNVDFITECAKLRKPIPTQSNKSFMQNFIIKTVELMNEIYLKYELLSRKYSHSIEALGMARLTCIEIIRDTQSVLCENYIAYPVEPESLQKLLKNTF